MLYKLCWACWIGGTAAIILSRFGLIPPEIGWGGFYVSCAGVLISYLPRQKQPQQADDWAVLTRAMLASKDKGYNLAVACLERGGTVTHDGLAFVARPDELVVAVVASCSAAEMSELQALQDAKIARETFAEIARQSPEVTALTAGKRELISLLSEYGPQGVEVCRVRDGMVEWINPQPTMRGK